jgi:hypothetical protein
LYSSLPGMEYDAMGEWVEWHAGYAPGTPLARRLALVQDRIRTALDDRPRGPIRIISMCAGDGRDILGVLTDHSRRSDASARLVELDPELASRARERAAEVSAMVDVVTGDASITSAYAGAVPADIVLVCGVFGNVSDEDVHRTVTYLPSLCAPNATVIWTRGTFEPDLTATVRVWFMEAGFTELDFVAIPDTTLGVGTSRLKAPPRAFEPGVRLFTFLPRDERPSVRSRAV